MGYLLYKVIKVCLYPPKTEVWRLFSKFFMANILFWDTKKSFPEKINILQKGTKLLVV